MEYVLFSEIKKLFVVLKDEEKATKLRNCGVKLMIQEELVKEKMNIVKRMGTYFRTLDERTIESLIITFGNIQLFSNEEEKEYYEIVKAIAFGAKADVKFEREANKYR